MFSNEEMKVAVRAARVSDPVVAGLVTAIETLIAAGKNLEDRVDAVAFLADALDSKVAGVATDVEVLKGGEK